MLITSSRKPSARTRILCKQLASFLNCEYLNRGKRSIGEVLYLAHGNPLIVVGEYHGNPGSLTVFDGEGECLLSVHLTAAFPSGFKYSKLNLMEPVIIGTCKLADAIVAAFSLAHGNDILYARCITVDNEKIDFIDSGKLIFSLRVKGFRFNG